MRKDRVHKQLAVAATSMLRKHEDINEVCKRGVVGDDACKRDLVIFDEAAEAQ